MIMKRCDEREKFNIRKEDSGFGSKESVIFFDCELEAYHKNWHQAWSNDNSERMGWKHKDKEEKK